MSRQKRRSPRRGGPSLSLTIGLLAVALIAGAAFGLATVWQRAEDAAIAADDKPPSIRTISPFSEEEAQAGPSGGEDDERPQRGEPQRDGEENPDSETSPSPEPFSFAGREAYPYAVPHTGSMVDTSYFDDALFLGDSLSAGLSLYDVIPGARVVAAAGIHPVNAGTEAAVGREDGTRVTLLEAAERYGERGKIYVMLGAEGLDAERELFLDSYREWIGALKKQYPKAVIYIQSILPIRIDSPLAHPPISNERIDDYNVGLMELAREMRVHYLDVAAAMVDQDGALPAEGAPDGMFLTGAYYFRWLDYLRSHTVAG